MDVLSKVLTGACLVLVVMLGISWFSIKGKNMQISQLQTDLVVEKTSKEGLKKAIEEQSAKITKYRLDLESVETRYKELEAKPAEIRFKTVYEKIPSIKVESDDCKDIKKLLDDITSTGY